MPKGPYLVGQGTPEKILSAPKKISNTSGKMSNTPGKLSWPSKFRWISIGMVLCPVSIGICTNTGFLYRNIF